MSGSNQNQQQPTKIQPWWQLYFDKDYKQLSDKITKKFLADSIPEIMHIAGLAMIGGNKFDIGATLLKAATVLVPESKVDYSRKHIKPYWDLYFKKNYQSILEPISKSFIDEAIPELLHLIGLTNVTVGNFEQGSVQLRAASVIMPQVVNWYANASVVLCEKNPADALSFAIEGLRIQPHDVLYFCEGNAHVALKNFEQALESFKKGLALKPSSVEILLNMGNTFRKLDRQQEAFEAYQKILEIDPTNHRAQFNIASYKMTKGEHVENAQEMCEDYLKKEDSAEVAFMLSLFLLDKGEYDAGWNMYNRRWESALTLNERKDIRAPIATEIEHIKNKRVTVFHEQGFGDSLQFCRYIPELQKHAGTVIAVVPPPLLRLFKNSFPDLKVVSSRDEAMPYDCEVPMLNMPHMFGTKLDTIPNKFPYFKVESVIKTPVKIGLVWAGHKRPDPDLAAVDSRRSMSFEDFLKIMEGFDPALFGSLQLGEPASQAENHSIPKLLNNRMDFQDSANIMAGLDLIITADTAPLHLASGIFATDEIKVIGLSRSDSCWRYSQKLTANKKEGFKSPVGPSPWHPNTLMIYQTEKGDWSNVIEDCRTIIRNRFK